MSFIRHLTLDEEIAAELARLHRWTERPAVEVRRTVNVSGFPFDGRSEPQVVPAWRQCSVCGMSEGLAEKMGWLTCSRASEVLGR